MTATKANWGIRVLEWLRSAAVEEFNRSKHFDRPAKIQNLAGMAEEIVSLGNQTGEGWFLTGEMLEFQRLFKNPLTPTTYLLNFDFLECG